MTPCLDVAAITRFHDQALAHAGWPDSPWQPEGSPAPGAIGHEIEANHRCNSLLWAEEDLARRVDVPDAAIAANKRAIDRLNQARNDAVERLDEAILTACPARGGRLHSETAGMMIDRLSILALKLHHTGRQLARADVDEAHRSRCRQRLAVLEEQRSDLAACLTGLLSDLAAGRARYKVYRQYKMYNDPRFNPHLAAGATSIQEGGPR